jgi:hypothetical protein
LAASLDIRLTEARGNHLEHEEFPSGRHRTSNGIVFSWEDGIDAGNVIGTG